MNCFELLNFKDQPGLTNELIHIANSVSYHTYITDKGTRVPLQYCSVPKTPHISNPHIVKLLNRFNKSLVVSTVLFIKFDRHEGIPPHVDDNLNRSSCVTWALSPEISQFAPVLFYKELGGPVSDTVFYTTNPLLLNTRVVHAVENNNYDRISFQVCFSNPIEELYELYTNNQFFTNDF